MKIAFSEKDRSEFKKLVNAMDDNEAAALFYNILLNGEEKVSESTLPYPIDRLSAKEYSKNPYFINVRPKAKKDGSFRLDYLKKPSHIGFVYDEMIVKGKYFEETTPFGYFDKPFEFLALLEKERIWMSVTPHEINTMKEPIKKAKGKVITLGLGLGDFAYMVEFFSFHLIDEDSNEYQGGYGLNNEYIKDAMFLINRVENRAEILRQNYEDKEVKVTVNGLNDGCQGGLAVYVWIPYQ